MATIRRRSRKGKYSIVCGGDWAGDASVRKSDDGSWEVHARCIDGRGRERTDSRKGFSTKQDAVEDLRDFADVECDC